MRLPKSVTAISPVGETVAAMEEEQVRLSAAVAEENRQMVVSTATEAGLTLWEADLGLARGSGLGQRRAAVRAALAGGQTLTPAALAALCVTVGGFDGGEVTENFSAWTVAVDAVAADRALPEIAPLWAAVERLRPAHLQVLVNPRADLTPPPIPCATALCGELFVEIGVELQA